MLIQTRRFSKTGLLQSGLLFNITLLCLGIFTISTQSFVAQNRHLYQMAGYLVLLFSLGSIYGIKFRKNTQRSVIIGVGSNSEPGKNIPQAIAKIKKNFKIRRKSSIYRTEAVKNAAEGNLFWNLVIEIGTKLSYLELRSQLKNIEVSCGRQPGEKTKVPMDLDILVFDREVFRTEGKTIPDPEINKYMYIAKPLQEMSPDFRHPANGSSITEIVEKLPDKSLITKTSEVPYEPEG
jgi:2-amino-4-hydroxy-6-hydroxymethyldihydropteridine diphosphokinase